MLREARMRAHIDISEIESETKIRAKYLRAIENEEWDLLPGPIYAKSFLRTYGDFLGLDSRSLVDEYRRRYERPTEHDLRPLSTLSRDRERKRRGPRLPSWAIVAIVLLAVLGLLAVIGQGNGTHTVTPPKAVAPLPTTTVTTHHRGRRHRALQAPRSVRLSVIPTGQVYVCLVDGAGHKLINQQVFNSGAKVPVERGTRLLLTLGNNAATVRVNGRVVPLAGSSTAIRLLLTPTSVKPIALNATPTCP